VAHPSIRRLSEEALAEAVDTLHVLSAALDRLKPPRS
jgi:hypothetical protein